MSDIYREKMNKLAPVPEDMRVFWAGKDIARIEARTTYILECIGNGIEIECSLDDMAQIIGGPARLVNDDQGEIINGLLKSAAVLVRATAEARGGRKKADASIWDRGYAVTTGRDPYEAYVALTVLEKAAEVQLKSRALGGVKPLSPSNIRKQRRKYLKKYSALGRERRIREFEKTIEEGREETGDILSELKVRKDLVEYGNLLVEKKLVQGTWGNISIRQDSDEMLTTPSGLDYDSLRPEDMVRVNIESMESDGSATSEVSLHAGIYKNRSDVGGVIHTHSLFSSILAACMMPLEIEEEDLKKELGDLIYISDYAEAGTDEIARNVINALGDRAGAIMSNHGMVAVGKNIEDAFNKTIAIEDAARRMVNERLIR